MKLATTALTVALMFLGCGSDSAATRREVAEQYVKAVEARNWQAACEVSVHDGMDECVAVLEEVYSGAQAGTPTVERTEAVVEEVDGRNLVHFEYTVIR